MEPKTEANGDHAGAADEAAVVELIDRIETLGSELADARAELERLRSERSDMQDELSTARGWVRVLATEVEELNCRLAGR
jgi:predicted nuclease with TOPRIM domain